MYLQASKLRQSLFMSRLLQDENHAAQVNYLMAQIAQNEPKISIYGYVDINRQLIPAVNHKNERLTINKQLIILLIST